MSVPFQMRLSRLIKVFAYAWCHEEKFQVTAVSNPKMGILPSAKWMSEVAIMTIWKLTIVFGIVLLFFGGKRLPSMATGLGQAIRNFKTALAGEEDEANKLSEKNSPKQEQA